MHRESLELRGTQPSVIMFSGLFGGKKDRAPRITRVGSSLHNSVLNTLKSGVTASPKAGVVPASVPEAPASASTGPYSHPHAAFLCCLPSAPASARVSLAGLLASAAAHACNSQHMHVWAVHFIMHVAVHLLGVHEETAAGLMPLITALPAARPPGLPPQLFTLMSHKLLPPSTQCGELGEAGRCAFLSGLPAHPHVRIAMLTDVVLLCVLSSSYDARVRTLLRASAHAMGVQWSEVGRREDEILTWVRAVAVIAGSRDLGEETVLAAPFPTVPWPVEDTFADAGVCSEDDGDEDGDEGEHIGDTIGAQSQCVNTKEQSGCSEDALLPETDKVRASQLLRSMSSPGGSSSTFTSSSSEAIISGRGGKKGSSEALRWAKLGVATVAGAGLLMATGGLAAPALLSIAGSVVGAAGGATIMGGSLTTALGFLGTMKGTALIVGAFGAAGGQMAGSRMVRRLGDVEEFRFEPLTDASILSDAGKAVLSSQWRKLRAPFKRVDSSPKPVQGSAPIDESEGKREETEGDVSGAASTGSTPGGSGLHVLIVVSGLVVSRTGEGDMLGEGEGEEEAVAENGSSPPAAPVSAPACTGMAAYVPTLALPTFITAASAPTLDPVDPYAGSYDFVRPWGDFSNADRPLTRELLRLGPNEVGKKVREQARVEAGALKQAGDGAIDSSFANAAYVGTVTGDEETDAGAVNIAAAALAASSSSSASDGTSPLPALVRGRLVQLIPAWRVPDARARIVSACASPGGLLYTACMSHLPWLGTEASPDGESEALPFPASWLEEPHADAHTASMPLCMSPLRGTVFFLHAGTEGADGAGVGWAAVGPSKCPPSPVEEAQGEGPPCILAELRVCLLDPASHGRRGYGRDALLAMVSSMRMPVGTGTGKWRVSFVFRPQLFVRTGKSARAVPGGLKSEEEEEEEEEEEDSEGEEEDIRAARARRRKLAALRGQSRSRSLIPPVSSEDRAMHSAASAAFSAALKANFQLLSKTSVGAPPNVYQHLHMELRQGSTRHGLALAALHGLALTEEDRVARESRSRVGEASTSGSAVPPADAPVAPSSLPPPNSWWASMPSLTFTMPTLATGGTDSPDPTLLPTTSSADVMRMVSTLSKLAVVQTGAIESPRGWLRTALPYGEAVACVWEPALLAELGDQITGFVQSCLQSKAMDYSVGFLLKRTLLAAAMSALSHVETVTKAFDWIDSNWSMVRLRAGKTGRVLARSLLSGLQGECRPVSLIGWGMGALAISKALEELADVAEAEQARAAAASLLARKLAGRALPPPAVAGGDGVLGAGSGFGPGEANELDIAAAAAAGRPFPWAFSSPSTVAGTESAVGKRSVDGKPRRSPLSLIQDVVLLGIPMSADPSRWARLRSVTNGRLVNGYCTRDFVLRVLHRANSVTWDCAGLRPVGVDLHDGDVTSLLQSALAPPDVTQAIRSVLQVDPAANVQAAPSWAGAGYASDGDATAETFARIGSVSGPASSTWPPCAPACFRWNGIDNVDITHIASGHLDYRNKMAQIMEYVGLDKA